MAGQDETGDGELRVVLVTAPDKTQGLALARGLVEEGLAACVNLVPGLTSVYRWQGAIEEESEVLLVIKSASRLRERLERWLAGAHPYDVPECIHLAPAAVEGRYRAWWGQQLDAELSAGAPPSAPTQPSPPVGPSEDSAQ